MSDNVNITAGVGTIVAADEVTRNAIAEKQQVIKISLGADGAFDTLVDSGQQTGANSIPVVLASDTALPAGTNAIGKLAANSGVDIGDVDVTSAVITGGTIADNGVDSGNPIKVGGRYNSSAPTYASGDRGDLQIDANGYLKVNVSAGSLGQPTADGDTFTTNSTQGLVMMGVYRSSADTIADGDAAAIGVDVNRNSKVTMGTLLWGEDATNGVMGVTQKPLPVSTYSPTVYTDLTQVTKAAVKAGTGNVLSCYITNENVTARYFQLHNKATAPAGTDVPIYSFKVPAGTPTSPATLIIGDDFWTKAGKNFSTGIGWAISTTYGTFTDSATASDHITIIHYI